MAYRIRIAHVGEDILEIAEDVDRRDVEDTGDFRGSASSGSGRKQGMLS